MRLDAPTISHLRELLGLAMPLEQRVELLSEIEKRDPDRVRVRHEELVGVLRRHCDADEIASLKEREGDRVIHEVKPNRSLRACAQRLGLLLGLLLIWQAWHLRRSEVRL